MRVIKKEPNRPYRVVNMDGAAIAKEFGKHNIKEKVITPDCAILYIRKTPDARENVRMWGKTYWGTIFVVGIKDEVYSDIPQTLQQLIRKIRRRKERMNNTETY